MKTKISVSMILVSVFIWGTQANPRLVANNDEMEIGLVKRSSMNKMGCLGMTCFSGGGGSDDEGQNQSRRHLNQSHRAHYREALSDDESEPRRSYHWDSEADLAASPEAQGARTSQRWDSVQDLNSEADEDYNFNLGQASESLGNLRIQAPRQRSFRRNSDAFDRHNNTPNLRSQGFERPRPSVTYTIDPNSENTRGLNIRLSEKHRSSTHGEGSSAGDRRTIRRSAAREENQNELRYRDVALELGGEGEQGTSQAYVSSSRQQRLRSQRHFRQENSQSDQDLQSNPEVQHHRQRESSRRSGPRIPRPNRSFEHQ